MSYYKLISGQNIVGAVSLNDFRRYQPKHGLILFSDIDSAQYAEFKGIYYRDDWLRATATDTVPYVNVSIIKIEEAEYNALIEAFEENEEIEIETDDEPIDDNPVQPDDEQSSLEFVREAKIAKMSRICEETIINGIDVVLSDGESHHFSLEIVDQIKIQALAMKAQSGEQTLFWHEDDKPCQFYSAEDILAMYAALEKCQVFQTTYFNSLKMYIMSMQTIEEISAVTYGMEIPYEYQSEVLRYLYNTMGGDTNE